MNLFRTHCRQRMQPNYVVESTINTLMNLFCTQCRQRMQHNYDLRCCLDNKQPAELILHRVLSYSETTKDILLRHAQKIIETKPYVFKKPSQ